MSGGSNRGTKKRTQQVIIALFGKWPVQMMAGLTLFLIFGFAVHFGPIIYDIQTGTRAVVEDKSLWSTLPITHIPVIAGINEDGNLLVERTFPDGRRTGETAAEDWPPEDWPSEDWPPELGNELLIRFNPENASEIVLWNYQPFPSELGIKVNIDNASGLFGTEGKDGWIRTKGVVVDAGDDFVAVEYDYYVTEQIVVPGRTSGNHIINGKIYNAMVEKENPRNISQKRVWDKDDLNSQIKGAAILLVLIAASAFITVVLARKKKRGELDLEWMRD